MRYTNRHFTYLLTFYTKIVEVSRFQDAGLENDGPKFSAKRKVLH